MTAPYVGYIAGPMRGYDEFNFPAFRAGAEKIRKTYKGAVDLQSPAEHDLEQGFDPLLPIEDQDFDLKAAFLWDVAAVLRSDLVFVLDGWQASEGAKIELQLAWTNGIPVYRVHDWTRVYPLDAVEPDAPTVVESGGYALKDSGQREQMSTGSVRDSRDGKGRYDLISPIAQRRLAGVYERGAAKYAARNWEKGQPLTRFLDSAKRHLDNHLEGQRDEDHLAQAMWNIAGMIHVEEMIRRGLLPAELDDLPNYLVSAAAPAQDGSAA